MLGERKMKKKKKKRKKFQMNGKVSKELLAFLGLRKFPVNIDQYLHIQVGISQELYLCLQLTVLQKTPKFH